MIRLSTYTGVVCQLSYHGGGSLQYTSDGKHVNIPFLQKPRSQPLQIGQQVRFSIIQQKAVDVEPADLLNLSDQRLDQEMRSEMRKIIRRAEDFRRVSGP